MSQAHLDPVTAYLQLGLAFDRLEPGFVDAYTGDPVLRREVETAPAPAPMDLANRAVALRQDVVGSALPARRREFIAAHLRALEVSGRKFAGEQVGFVDEVQAYFDVRIAKGDQDGYREAHRLLELALPGPGTLAERMDAHRRSQQVPPEQLTEAVHAFSSALRDLVRSRYPLPEQETVEYEIVTDKPWSGFNYYLGGYRSRVAINADLPQQLSHLPALIAHEAYPGHHTEHSRKEAGLVAAGEREQTLFLVNTPQCLMAEGLADLALEAIVGPEWAQWAAGIYAELGIRFDAETAAAISTASKQLLTVRQDAALMLHDEHRSVDDVAAYLQRWSLASRDRAQHQLRFLSSPLWRAYISTYVEGYQLLSTWLAVADDAPARAERFRRLLDEPLIPSSLRAELAGDAQ